MTRDSERGLALVVTLWILAVLSLIAATLSHGVRVEARIARNTLSSAEARAAAEAGVAYGIARVLAAAAGAPQPWQLDGSTYRVPLAGQTVAIAVTQESGKIDVNAADVALLRSLLAAAGATPDEAEAIADAIADFRDADSDRHLKGAEDADYAAAGSPFPPKNAPLESVDELQQVLGLTPALFRTVRAAVTVVSGLPSINPAFAPRLALLALPGVEVAQVEALLAARAENQYGFPRRPLPLLTGVDPWLATTEIPVFLIRAEVATAAGARFTREALVWATEQGAKPAWILDWRPGPPS